MTITYEISSYSIHEIKAKDQNVNGDNVFLCELIKFMRKKTDNFIPNTVTSYPCFPFRL